MRNFKMTPTALLIACLGLIACPPSGGTVTETGSSGTASSGDPPTTMMPTEGSSSSSSTTPTTSGATTDPSTSSTSLTDTGDPNMCQTYCDSCGEMNSCPDCASNICPEEAGALLDCLMQHQICTFERDTCWEQYFAYDLCVDPKFMCDAGAYIPLELVCNGVGNCGDNSDEKPELCCGDGVAIPGVEECDDGNKEDKDSCTNTCQHRDCWAEAVQPFVGEWTPDYEPITDCTCKAADPLCQAIYRLRPDNIEVNTLTASAQKTEAQGSGGPSVEVTYWAAAVPDDVLPNDMLDCSDREIAEVHKEGKWPAMQAPLQVEVPIWKDMMTFEAAVEGDKIEIFWMSGGSDATNAKRWWSRDPMSFVKVCEADNGLL